MAHQLEQIVSTLGALLATQLGDRAASMPIAANTSIISSGLLDSVALLEFVLKIEETFDIEIPHDELSLELLSTLGSLAKGIQRKLNASDSNR